MKYLTVLMVAALSTTTIFAADSGIEILKAENEALKKENQSLRQTIASTTANTASGRTTGNAQPGASPDKKKLPSLDEEAMALASKTFLEHWSKCGDSYVTRLSNADPETPNYTEITGVTLGSGSRELRKEDKLNGIEWDGRVWIKPEAERSYFAQDHKFDSLGSSFYGVAYKAGWEKWISGYGLPSFSLTKINGEWKCSENLKELNLDNKQPVQCDELPK